MKNKINFKPLKPDWVGFFTTLLTSAYENHHILLNIYLIFIDYLIVL